MEFRLGNGGMEHIGNNEFFGGLRDFQKDAVTPFTVPRLPFRKAHDPTTQVL